MGLNQSKINKTNEKNKAKINEEIKEDMIEDVDEEIKEENIINEDNEIVDYQKLRTIMPSKLETKIYKILREINKNGKITLLIGSGFFCDISSLNIKGFMTNNHVIDQTFI